MVQTRSGLVTGMPEPPPEPRRRVVPDQAAIEAAAERVAMLSEQDRQMSNSNNASNTQVTESESEEALCAVLQDRRSEWTTRIQCMEQLVQRGSNSSAKYEWVERLLALGLAEGLKLQVGELRSMVVVAACDNLVALADNMGEACEPILVTIFPKLCELLMKTKAVMKDAGHRCIGTLVSMDLGPEFQDLVIRTATEHKNPAPRAHCTGYLNDLLGILGAPWVAERQQTLIAVISKNTNDLKPEVRAAAKTLFQSLSGKYPEISREVLSGLDERTRKRLL